MYTLGKKVRDDGVWKDFSGAKLLIGRAGSVEFLKATDEVEKPYRKKIDRGTLNAKTRRDLNLRALARAVLLDWKEVQGENGDALPYTEEHGFQALLQDPDLLEFIIDVSVDNDNFKLEQEAETVKKSGKQ